MIDHNTLLAIEIVVFIICALIVAAMVAIWLPPIMDRRFNKKHPRYVPIEERFWTLKALERFAHYPDWDWPPRINDWEELGWLDSFVGMVRPTDAQAQRAEEVARDRGWLDQDGRWRW